MQATGKANESCCAQRLATQSEASEQEAVCGAQTARGRALSDRLSRGQGPFHQRLSHQPVQLFAYRLPQVNRLLR
jgi:hypothetical protein